MPLGVDGQKWQASLMVGSPKKRARREALTEVRTVGGDLSAGYVAAMPSPDARKIGRPTRYRSEFCEAVIEDAALGHTLTATAALFGVTRQTLHEWRQAYPEFAEAVEKANAIRQRFYEGHLIDMVRRGGDSTRMSAVKLALINVAGNDWREKLSAEHNVTFSLAALVQESMKLAASPIEGGLPAPENGNPLIRVYPIGRSAIASSCWEPKERRGG